MTTGTEVKEKAAVRTALIFVVVRPSMKNRASKYSLRVGMCKEPFQMLYM